jgi:glycyl-tRNA synthetase beta chain
MDTIVSFFSIGLIPTGSQDPYALRRQATGIIQTLIDKNWNLPLEELVETAIGFITNPLKMEKDELFQNIIAFFKLRIKYILQEQGIRYDLIDAVIGNQVGIVASLLRKAKVLEAHKLEEGFKEGMEALSRVLNISSKATSISAVQPALFENEFEAKLYKDFLSVKEKIVDNTDEEDFFQLLFSLKDSISDYFEHTMVMEKNIALKDNRLNQMVELAHLIRNFANVNEIVVK